MFSQPRKASLWHRSYLSPPLTLCPIYGHLLVVVLGGDSGVQKILMSDVYVLGLLTGSLCRSVPTEEWEALSFFGPLQWFHDFSTPDSDPFPLPINPNFRDLPTIWATLKCFYFYLFQIIIKGQEVVPKLRQLLACSWPQFDSHLCIKFPKHFRGHYWAEVLSAPWALLGMALKIR